MSFDETPMLSTTDRGRKMTQLLPAQPVGRVDAGIALLATAGVAAWAIASSVPYAALLGLAPTSALNMALGSPWAVAAALAVAVLALVLTGTAHQRVRRTFGQRRAAGLVASATVTGGLSAGAIGWTIASYARVPAPPFDLGHIATSPTIPRELGVVLGAAATAWAIGALCRLVPGLRHARSRQQTIARLRQAGTRHDGVVGSPVATPLQCRSSAGSGSAARARPSASSRVSATPGGTQ